MWWWAEVTRPWHSWKRLRSQMSAMSSSMCSCQQLVTGNGKYHEFTKKKNHYLILELHDHMPRWHTLGIPEKDSDMGQPPWAQRYRDMTSMCSRCRLATGNSKYQELTKKRIHYFMLYLNHVMMSRGDTPLVFLKKIQKWDVRSELEYAFSSTVSDRERQHYTTKLVHDRCHAVTCLWAFNAITWVRSA